MNNDMLLGKNTKTYKFLQSKFRYFNFNIWEVCYSKFDFLICVPYRSQCHEYHGIVYFAQKLQLHYNIYTLIFPIWMENIIKIKIPLFTILVASEACDIIWTF